mmetsp:Transcript_31001/g.81511  ORF Transcript_31001/g.81511 Transcript_31001/m.81511 type:complete len:217 (+) Transcript_31001:170-820(+)
MQQLHPSELPWAQSSSPWHSGHRSTRDDSEGTPLPQPPHLVQPSRPLLGLTRKQLVHRTDGVPLSQGKADAHGRLNSRASESPLPFTACTQTGSVGRSTRSAAHMQSCWVGASSTSTNEDCSCGSVASCTQSKGSPRSEKYLGAHTSYFSTGLAGFCVSGNFQLISYFREPGPDCMHRGAPEASGAAGTSAQACCSRRRISSLAACTRLSASAPAS